MSQYFKRLTSLAVATAMTATLLAGCGGAKETATSTEAGASSAASSATEVKKDEVINLTFLDWESKEMNVAIAASFDEFTAENPNVKVTLNPAPLQDYGLKISQMIAAKQAPDAFMVGNDMVLKYGAEGMLMDINKYTDADAGFLEKFYPGVFDSWKIDGKIYGLPGLMNMYGIFYNKKLLTEKGIAFPTKEWTYKDMLDMADKLKDTSKKVYGLYGNTPDVYHMGVYSAANGGAGFTDAIFPVTKVQAAPQFLEGIALYQEKIKSGAIPPRGYNADNLMALFMQGKVPMMQYGQWAVDQLTREAKDLEWGFVPNPKGTQQSTIYDAVGWAVPKSTPHPDEAYKLLKYIVTKTYEKVLPQFPVAPTACTESAKPYYDKLKELGHADVAEGLDYMASSPNKQPVRIAEAFADKANKFLETYWNAILDGKKPVSELDKMVQSINDVIASAKK